MIHLLDRPNADIFENNLNYFQHNKMEQQEIDISKLPADIIVLLAKENPEVFNRLIRSSVRFGQIGYERVLADVCYAPLSYREIFRLSPLIDDLIRFKEIKVNPGIFTATYFPEREQYIRENINCTLLYRKLNNSHIILSGLEIFYYTVQAGYRTLITDSDYNTIPILTSDDLLSYFRKLWNSERGFRYIAPYWFYIVIKRRLSCMRLNSKFAIEATVRYTKNYINQAIEVMSYIHSTAERTIYRLADDLLGDYISNTAEALGIKELTDVYYYEVVEQNSLDEALRLVRKNANKLLEVMPEYLIDFERRFYSCIG